MYRVRNLELSLKLYAHYRCFANFQSFPVEFRVPNTEIPST